MLFYMEPSNIFQATFPGIDNSLQGYNQQEPMKPHIQAISAQNNIQMVDYILTNPPPSLPLSSNCYCSNSFNKLCSSGSMQYVEFDPKLALNQAKSCEEDTAVMFNKEGLKGLFSDNRARAEEYTSLQQSFHGEYVEKSKRKRLRTTKTREEVECQRMTHITVERNRRKQMNEHLRVLRSLMPNSYVQRGDQASIVGGAIEFVRELEHLLQCLESQKRQRMYGNEHEIELQVETAESKTCLAEVEVKLTGSDGLIKILSRKRPCLLIKTIAALDDLHLHILHINVTTIEQSVLCSLNVKMSVEARLKAADIADSIQQVLSLIHANQ